MSIPENCPHCGAEQETRVDGYTRWACYSMTAGSKAAQSYVCYERQVTALKMRVTELETALRVLEADYEAANMGCGDQASLLKWIDKAITKALKPLETDKQENPHKASPSR